MILRYLRRSGDRGQYRPTATCLIEEMTMADGTAKIKKATDDLSDAFRASLIAYHKEHGTIPTESVIAVGSAILINALNSMSDRSLRTNYMVEVNIALTAQVDVDVVAFLERCLALADGNLLTDGIGVPQGHA